MKTALITLITVFGMSAFASPQMSHKCKSADERAQIWVWNHGIFGITVRIDGEGVDTRFAQLASTIVSMTEDAHVVVNFANNEAEIVHNSERHLLSCEVLIGVPF